MRASVHFVTLPGDPLITDLASLSALLLRLRAGLGVLVLGFLGFFVGFSASTMILHYCTKERAHGMIMTRCSLLFKGLSISPCMVTGCDDLRFYLGKRRDFLGFALDTILRSC